ncbi:centromere/kinetochore protein zw10 homolog [Panonychus citri]|uniref:centromere/kinetochore protein zw10 homolog n=1 Tax=Panonychus citri TaxID=50023 RepID=UPI002306E80A|nr:centromere/kinetochore protein zw10 homolog [Panonychus citri]
MEILVKWLNSGELNSKLSIDQLIGELSKEIETIESSIREKLNVRDEEQFRDYFSVINKFIGQMNVSLDQANGQLKAFEGDTGVKIRELRDVLLQRNKQLQEAASKLTPIDGDNEDVDVVSKGKEGGDDYLGDSDYNQGIDVSNHSPSPLRIQNPVDEEETRQLRLTEQLVGDDFVKARTLINSDLFPVIQVGDDISQVIPSNSPTINQSLFSFPICSVSQSIFDLNKLLEQMMKKARDYSDHEERYLAYQATRSVLELYLVSQSVHQTKINDLPKYTAIFHNNCLWIAHQLTILPMVYGLWDRDNFTVTFVDLIPALKETAQDAIIDTMKKQKQILTDFFDESEVRESLKAASCEDSTGNRTLIPFSKSLRKGLTHIKSIKSLWIDCLPSSVCNKLIGTLVNCLIAVTINAILTLEDIPADTATRLGDILDGITKEIDQLMKDFTLPYGQILPKWLQFQEIKIVLQASLADIVDRWSEGNGPLAVAFTPEEVKSLIRSLFQNTDRRSAALTRIR